MRILLRILLVLIFAVVGWWLWPFLQGPEDQVTHQQQRLINIAQSRNWGKVGDLLAEDFEDQWGSRKRDALSLASDVTSGFLALYLTWEVVDVVQEGDLVKIRGHIKVEGSGGGLSQEVINRTKQIKEPWVFTWRKDGWQPSDWRLISVKNKELDGQIPKW